MGKHSSFSYVDFTRIPEGREASEGLDSKGSERVEKELEYG